MNGQMGFAPFAQRRIATLALLLASFLEICGCNPRRTCEELRAAHFSTMPIEALMVQCARCLSEPELAALRRAREGPVSSDLGIAFVHDVTVEEVLGELHEPSFNAYVEGTGETNSFPEGSGASGRSGGLLQQAKPIAWPIPESVLFLYAPSPSGSMSGAPGYRDALRRIATGFILSVPERRGLSSRYLVTARHVVDPEWAHCKTKNPHSITVRFNRRSGGVGYELIQLEAHDEPTFITAKDDLTDLALLPISSETVARLSDYRMVETHFENLPTETELGMLKKEQQIVTVGVSRAKLAGLTDSPISQPGLIATNVSGGRMGVRCAVESQVKPIQMWLIDAAVEPGVSGAPVYAALTRAPSNSAIPVLVGIQAVVWPDKGRAGITPVSALRNLIEQKRIRDEVAINLPKEHPH